MLSSFIAIVFSAFAFTAAAAPGAQLTSAVQPVAAKAAVVVKAALVRPQAGAASDNLAPTPQSSSSTAATAKAESDRGVSLEMVLAALALMMVVTVRRYRSGPR